MTSRAIRKRWVDFGCTKSKNLYMANKGNNQLKYKNIFNISDKGLICI